MNFKPIKLTKNGPRVFSLNQTFFSYFHRLNVEDQKRLLELNTPLFIQFRLGTFLAKNHVKEEVMTTPEVPTTPSSNFLNFRHLDNRLKLFRTSANLDDYQQLVNELRCLPNATRCQCYQTIPQ